MPLPTRFLREDILSGVVVEMTLEEWSYSSTLCRPGDLRAKVPLTSPDATEAALSPYTTALYAVRGSEIEWGGILSPPSLGVGDTAMAISCFGWLGYWDHRTIRKPYTGTQVEQFSIFKQLVDDAQDEGYFGAGYDLGITVEWDAPSGVLRDRTYDVWESKNLGEALRQLAAVEDGFDVSMRFMLNTTTDRVDKYITLSYPRKGRETGYTFEYVRNATTNVISRGFADPVAFAWVGDGWGSGNDATRLRSPYVDESARGVFPPYDAAPSWSTVIEQATLDEHAAAAFARTNRPKRIPVLRVDPDAYPLWSDYAEGDIVNVMIDDGYGSTTPHSAERFRITTKSVTSGGQYDIVLADQLPPLAVEERP